MEQWKPATKKDVEAELSRVAEHAGPESWPRYARHLIDPYPVLIDRAGRTEQAFVVARLPSRVVFFDDIEGDFGTAVEINGTLIEVAMYGDLRVAVKEAEAGA